jgi:CubicO group peptidase (beta-lactamase class C family)
MALLIFALALPLTLVSQEQDLDSIILHQIESFHDSTEVAIALIRDGQVEYIGKSKASGRWIKTDHQHSIFGIGSVSKVFTSLLLSQAITDKQVEADAFVSEHLNSPLGEGGKSITLLQLCNHTSGLPRLPSNLTMDNPRDPYVSYKNENLNAYLENHIETLTEAGKVYAYSNLGTSLLGFLLSQTYSEPYETLYSKRVFRPLQMESTSTTWDKLDKTKIVSARDAFGNKMKSWDFQAHLPAGGIKSTIHDMSKFLQAFFSDENIAYGKMLEPTFTVNEKLQLGMGWHISTDSENKLIHWHNGATGGYRSFVALQKDQQIGVIILSNVSAFHAQNGNIDILGFQLLKAIQP